MIVLNLPKNLSNEEMLNLSELKQTRFYQEVKQEGIEEGERQAKLDAIPRLLEFGLSLEQIAQCLDLSLEFVQQTITQIQGKFMSFSEKNIYTFIELLTKQRSLFDHEQLKELEKLVKPLSDDLKTLSNAISEWSEKHSEIKEARYKLLNPLLSSNNAEKAPGSGEGNVPEPDYDLNKKILQNAIQQGSVSDQSQSSEKK